MQNIPYNSTQNILNISQELGLTIPEAQALVNQGMRGAQQGPLDMLVKELSNKASADAYRQLQGQVFKQAPKSIGQTVKGLGTKGLGQLGLLYGMYDAGNSMNKMFQQNLMNNFSKAIQSYDNYILEPTKR